jgi:hypothetical protein
MFEILVTNALRTLLLSMIAALCLRAAMKHFVDGFCNGSLQEVLIGMADARTLDPRTLRRLAWRMDEAKTKGGQ